MKKTFKKIVICLVAIGVVFFTTPFLIKTKADNIETTVYDLGTVSGSSGTYTWSYNVKYEPLGEDYSYQYAYHVRFLVVSANGWNQGNEDSDFIGTYCYNLTNSKIYDYAINSLSPTYYFYDISYDGDYMQMDMFIRDEYTTLDNKPLYRFEWTFVNSDSNDDNVFNYYRRMLINNESLIISSYTNGYNDGEDAGYVIGYQAGQTDTITNINPSNWISNIGVGVGNILSIPIFGSITLGTLVFIPIAMSVLLLLLHIWRRN